MRAYLLRHVDMGNQTNPPFYMINHDYSNYIFETYDEAYDFKTSRIPCIDQPLWMIDRVDIVRNPMYDLNFYTIDEFDIDDIKNLKIGAIDDLKEKDDDCQTC